MKKRLNIALVIPSLYNPGGIEYFGQTLTEWLVQRGHQLVVFTRKKTASDWNEALPLHPKIEVSPFYFPDDIEKLRVRLILFQTDLLIPMYGWNEVIQWFKVLYGTAIPILYSERNDPQIIELKRRGRIERQTSLKVVDTIHMMIDSFRESVPEKLQFKIRIIPHFARYKNRQINRHERVQKKLLSLGRLCPEQKQITMLVQAFALIQRQFPDWSLEIWGDGQDRENIELEIIRQEISDRVCLKGVTTDSSEQFSQSDLFCIPSRYEGFGNTVVEAMSHGLPVVGFAECSGVNWIVQDGVNGVLAPEMTAESLAQALSKLMGDDELRQKMSDAALVRAADFDKETILTQWEEMIYECVSHKGNTALQRALAELEDPESNAAHLNLLWRLNATFEERMEYFSYPLIQYVHYKRNKWFVKWPWKIILKLWRIKNRIRKR